MKALANEEHDRADHLDRTDQHISLNLGIPVIPLHIEEPCHERAYNTPVTAECSHYQREDNYSSYDTVLYILLCRKHQKCHEQGDDDIKISDHQSVVMRQRIWDLRYDPERK